MITNIRDHIQYEHKIIMIKNIEEHTDQPFHTKLETIRRKLCERLV
jgi:hypothetical protein